MDRTHAHSAGLWVMCSWLLRCPCHPLTARCLRWPKVLRCSGSSTSGCELVPGRVFYTPIQYRSDCYSIVCPYSHAFLAPAGRLVRFILADEARFVVIWECTLFVRLFVCCLLGGGQFQAGLPLYIVCLAFAAGSCGLWFVVPSSPSATGLALSPRRRTDSSPRSQELMPMSMASIIHGTAVLHR